MISLHDPRLTAVGLLSEAASGLSARLSPTLAEAGLGEVDFETLIRLARSPGHSLRMSDLAAQTGMSTSGITRVVDRLERDGMVCRRACATDRRAQYATLTDAGLRRLEEVLPKHLDDIQTWLTGLLTDQQLAALLDGLRVVRDAVRPGATAGADSRDGLAEPSLDASHIAP